MKSIIKTAFFATLLFTIFPQVKADNTTNPAIDCIMSRSSVRNYADTAVPDSVIGNILRAAMAAPTAVNRQPWEFIVVTDRALLDSIAGCSRGFGMLKKAPAAIIVCGNFDRFFDGDTPEVGFWALDCSAATENLLLAAHSLGLGAVWCGVYPKADRANLIRQILNIPANMHPFALIPFGYPEGPQTPKEKWDPAKIHYNRF